MRLIASSEELEISRSRTLRSRRAAAAGSVWELRVGAALLGERGDVGYGAGVATPAEMVGDGDVVEEGSEAS